jgi:membrane protease YdiL (CAAX protease family)
MPDESPSERAGAFVRSVLPAEPAHWLMLVGATLLLISANLVWWSGPLPAEAESFVWRVRVVMFSRLFLISGAAAYYLCLVRSKGRGDIPFLLTLVPAAAAAAVMLGLPLSWTARLGGRISVIERAPGYIVTGFADVIRTLLKGLDIGFWLPTLGCVLVAIVFVMCRTGRATLPIRLASPMVPLQENEEDASERRLTLRFVWIMISFTFLASAAFGLIFSVLSSQVGEKWWWANPNSLAAFDAATLLALVLVAAKPHAKALLAESLRLPPPVYLGLGILIPAILAALWPAARYLWDWMTFESGSIYAPPELSPYFSFAIASSLGLVAPALVEEIAWRGFLQPRFIGRYGMARGIFFVGLAWGAFHFTGDVHGRMTGVAILLQILWRLCTTVSQSFVLAWLTIRSRSVLPAALAHGFYNIFLRFPVREPIWGIPLLWGACACILFRYFPVQAGDQDAGVESKPTWEPAI